MVFRRKSEFSASDYPPVCVLSVERRKMMNAKVIGIDAVMVDAPEFDVMMRKYQAMVFGIACNFLNDRAAADDVAQEVFLKLYKTLSRLETEAHVKAWLCKVAGHRCIDYLRRRRNDLTLDEIPEPVSANQPGDPVLSSHLRKLVASLPPKARLVIVLRYQEEFEPEEISRMLGWRLNTVRSLLQRSLKMLNEKMSRTFGEADL
jgi:RNA polymerase sigma-70 factor (ECF subfamily)